MKNILLAADVKSSDDILLEHSLMLARAFGSKIWIMHVAAPDPDFVGYDAGPQNVREKRAQELQEEHRKLQKYLEGIEKEGVEAEALLVQGPTLKTLEKQIDELTIDLVIMGGHKHGAFYELMFGNTSVEMVRLSKVPVTIIPLPK